MDKLSILLTTITKRFITILKYHFDIYKHSYSCVSDVTVLCNDSAESVDVDTIFELALERLHQEVELTNFDASDTELEVDEDGLGVLVSEEKQSMSVFVEIENPCADKQIVDITLYLDDETDYDADLGVELVVSSDIQLPYRDQEPSAEAVG